MKIKWGLVGIIVFVLLLVVAPTFSAVSITINPANPADSDALTCLMNGNTKNFNAHWKGSGVTQQNIIVNPLPASKTKPGKATCEAYVPNPVGGSPILVGSASVTILAGSSCINNIPPASNIPDQTINMNTPLSINLSNYISDSNNNSLNFTINNENVAEVDCSISGNTLILTPAANYVGTASCTVRATDSCNAIIDDSFAITVNYVDSYTPVVSLIDTITFDEDTTATLNLDNYVSDADTPDANLIWTVSGNYNVQITIDPVTHIATFTPALNWYGSEDITFTANDPAGHYGQDNVLIVVNSVNDLPWIDPIIPDQTVIEDSLPWTLDLKNYQNDIEIGPLTWTVSGVDTSLFNIVIDANNIAIFTLVPTQDGSDIITFTLTDAQGDSVTQDVLVTISNIDHPPVVSPIPDVRMYEDMPNTADPQIDLDYFVTDADNLDSDMTWTALTNKPEVSAVLNPIDNTVSYSLAQDYYGYATITLTACDPTGLCSSDDIFVTVIPMNDAPVVSDIPSITFDEDMSDSSIDLDNYVSDVDNTLNEITWTYSGDVNVHVNIDSDNIITFTANPNWNGQETITFTATDLGGLSDSDDVLVSVNPINDAPVLEDIHDITIDEDTIYTITNLDSYVNDIEDSFDQLVWSVSGNSNVNVIFDSIAKTVTFTPNPNWNGQETITITATDTGLLSDSDSLIFTVNSVNDAPWIDPAIPDQIQNEDSLPWSLDLSAPIVYEHDIEDANLDLDWSVSGIDTALFTTGFDA
ncbi:tandem-95 repeat protein, partial [Candidatus Woesearchaeota archaeon]|nr:tandem-95 repeat protein [Candidatus Woesearchaeota archaeon]